jgi:hypothetical protein
MILVKQPEHSAVGQQWRSTANLLLLGPTNCSDRGCLKTASTRRPPRPGSRQFYTSSCFSYRIMCCCLLPGKYIYVLFYYIIIYFINLLTYSLISVCVWFPVGPTVFPPIPPTPGLAPPSYNWSLTPTLYVYYSHFIQIKTNSNPARVWPHMGPRWKQRF